MLGSIGDRFGVYPCSTSPMQIANGTEVTQSHSYTHLTLTLMRVLD
jgi:hypothetical protein